MIIVLMYRRKSIKFDIWWDRGSVQAADLLFFLSSNKTNEFNITPNAGYGLVATSNATAVL